MSSPAADAATTPSTEQASSPQDDVPESQSTLDGLKQSAAAVTSSINNTLAAALPASIAPRTTSADQQAEADFIFADLFSVTARLHSATSLPTASDTYVTLQMDEETRQSRTVKHSQQPEWNESFGFVLKQQPTELKVQLWEWHRLVSNKLLGEAVVDLKEVVDSTASVDKTVTLHAAGGGSDSKGEVKLTLTASRIAHVVGRSSTAELSGVKEEDIDALVSMIDLTVRSANHLRHESFLTRNNSFAVVSYGFQSFRTAIVPHSDNPEYQALCPIWQKRDTQSFILKIAIYDHKVARKHAALIGNAFIPVKQLKHGQQYSLTLPLTKEDPQTDADLETLLSNLKFDANNHNESDFNGQPCVSVQVVVKERQAVENEFYDHVMKVYDENGDGKLEEEEVVHLIHTVGADIEDEDVAKAMQDTAGDKQQAQSGKEDEQHLVVTREQLPALFRHKVFHDKDFLRTVHAIMIHGKDALHTLMMKDFMYSSHADQAHTRGSHPQSATQSSELSADPTVDNHNPHLLIFDREAGVVVKEEIPSYIKSGMELLYRSRGGRLVNSLARTQRTLKQLTVKHGKKMDSTKSASGIPVFVHTHHLNLSEVEKPVSEYSTFNNFFYRKLKPGVRSCEAPDDDNVCVSAADCRLMCLDSVDEAKRVWIKGRHFSISEMLGAADKDGKLSAQFNGGSMAIFRLAPQDYHRWHWPVSGKVQARTPIDGEYNTVNPLAVRKDVDVFTENKRSICPLDSPQFGLVVLIAVGASMVGSINFVSCRCAGVDHNPPEGENRRNCQDGKCVAGDTVRRFDEHGYFAFGGSTCIVLFRPGVIAFDADIRRNSEKSMETLVKVGRRIGVATKGGKQPSTDGQTGTKQPTDSSGGKETNEAGGPIKVDENKAE